MTSKEYDKLIVWVKSQDNKKYIDGYITLSNSAYKFINKPSDYLTECYRKYEDLWFDAKRISTDEYDLVSCGFIYFSCERNNKFTRQWIHRKYVKCISIDNYNK